MVDPKLFLATAFELAGHRCPATPLGLRAGAAAMNHLGVARSEDRSLYALLELGDDNWAGCFADAVQTVTGCTAGKGNLKQLGYGKFALTLVDTATGRGVRVAARAEILLELKRSAFFQQYRRVGVPASQVPSEVVDPLIERVLSAPDEILLSVSEVFASHIALAAEDFRSFVCDRCGEIVAEVYGRVVGSRKLCIPCQEELLKQERLTSAA